MSIFDSWEPFLENNWLPIRSARRVLVLTVRVNSTDDFTAEKKDKVQ